MNASIFNLDNRKRDNCMVIKPGKVVIQQMVISAICLLCLDVVVFIDSRSVALGLLFTLITFLIMLPWCIASGRTLIMDESGCTVCLLGYKRHYRWSELTTKQYIHYENCFEYRSLCTEAAEFSVKKARIPKWMKAYTYSQFFRPFSFFFVYFPPDPRPKNEGLYPIIYEADEQMFRAKMKEWHVEMKEVIRGK